PFLESTRRASQIIILIPVVPGVLSILTSNHSSGLALAICADVENIPQQKRRWHINLLVEKFLAFSQKRAVSFVHEVVLLVMQFTSHLTPKNNFIQQENMSLKPPANHPWVFPNGSKKSLPQILKIQMWCCGILLD